MKSGNQIMLLREESIKPSDNVLENALGIELYAVYLELMNIINNEFKLDAQWRFYKDGNAWLCKIVNGKKTIFWLSVWEGYIKAGFYFTEKTRSGILELEINKKIKEDFSEAKPIGKLLPLIVNIDSMEQLDDLRIIMKFKKELK